MLQKWFKYGPVHAGFAPTALLVMKCHAGFAPTALLVMKCHAGFAPTALLVMKCHAAYLTIVACMHSTI